MKRIGSAEIAGGRGVEVNLSPLIDCVFLLLIFFIVTTVFVEEPGVEIKRPRAQTRTVVERGSIRLVLQSDGRIRHAGREIALNSVRGIVGRELAVKARPVVIVADAASRTGRLVELVDECKLAGAELVSVAAESPETGVPSEGRSR
jgi:biopolymer transport protein ExbD